MLVDQDDTDVLALGREALEGGLDRGVVGLVVYDEEVLLGVGGWGDVLWIGVSALATLGPGEGEREDLRQFQQAADLLRSPSSR